MSDLIPVFQADSQQLLCNARDLHAFLEVGRDFSTWIRARIDQYGFIEGEDYIAVQNLSSPNPGSAKARPQQVIDYHLTIGMAKELAMIENNAMGRRVRRYFIQRERQALELLQRQATEVQPLEQVRKRIKDTPKFRYLLILQEQSHTLARKLTQCEHPRERFNLHCSLRQVNNALGIPTEPLEVWDGSQALTSEPEG
ncbi:MAG: phage antirepressor Ant [Gammaproteobacteria bacterium]|nr:phage antirepressor Ant [Gammaproteobacteria bacterium]